MSRQQASRNRQTPFRSSRNLLRKRVLLHPSHRGPPYVSMHIKVQRLSAISFKVICFS